MSLLSAGNFVSWPLLEDQISRFHHNIKPYWLTPPLAAVTRHGLLKENALWSVRCNYVAAPLHSAGPSASNA